MRKKKDKQTNTDRLNRHKKKGSKTRIQTEAQDTETTNRFNDTVTETRELNALKIHKTTHTSQRDKHKDEQIR